MRIRNNIFKVFFIGLRKQNNVFNISDIIIFNYT